MSTIKDIDELRVKIDHVDYEILEKLKDRFELARYIGKVKQEFKLQLRDEEREKAVLQKVLSQCKTLGLPRELISDIWKLILNHSFLIQRTIADDR